MEQSKPINYYMIGSFIVAGLVLLVVAFILFGSGILQRTIYMETYFNESVQGLAVGSPVKYLGMEIGHVKEITTVDNVYKLGRVKGNGIHDRYIYVKMAISPNFFTSKASGSIEEEIKKDVASGLRVKLALQGLTGNAYLELDFLDPKTHPGLETGWTPDYYYIPSTTSTLTYFSDNVQYLLEELKNVNLKRLFTRIQQFVNSAQAAADKSNKLLLNTAPALISSADNLRNITNNLTSLTERARGFSASVLFGKNPPKLNPGEL